MIDGLKAKYRTAIICILSANERVERAVLFGSRAMETFTPASDIDIALYGDHLTLTDQANLATAIDELPMAQRVDLLLYATVNNEALCRHIEEHGVEWYRRRTMPERLDLPRRYRDRIEALLREHVPSVEVWAYGSRVNGRSHEGSDLDLVLRGPDLQRIPSSQLLDLTEALEESNVPILVQAHDWAELPESLHREIEREYVVLAGGAWRKVPLPEQRAIAHILGTLDDKIELNRRMNETLEEMARAIFKDWFVDFGPTRAKMEGLDTGLPTEVAALFPDRLVESELGEVPEGWEVVPLPEVIEVNPPRSLRRKEVAPYLDMANMPTRGHAPDAITNRPFGSGMRFTNGDTLVARITPCLENGKTAYVDFLPPDRIGWGSTEYIVMRPMPPLPNEFAYCLARSARFREFAIQNMTGTSGRQCIPAKALSQFLLPSPPEPIAARFGTVVQPLFARASEAVSESRTLAALRDALLPKLVSGEMRVSNAESF